MADEIQAIKRYKFFDLEFKTLLEAAEFFKVTKQMMSAVFSGKKKPTKAMLDKAGVVKITRKVTSYKKLTGEDNHG